MLSVPKSKAKLFDGMAGNTGDKLIWLGTHQWLHNLPLTTELNGEGTIVFPGSGVSTRQWERGWFWKGASYDKIVVLPAMGEETPTVRKFLNKPNVIAYARDKTSNIPGTILAKDLALKAFPHEVVPGTGTLEAWRHQPGDISLEIPSLKAWLNTIARHAEIHTDRLHVTVAALMMGKRVRYKHQKGHVNNKIKDYLEYNFPHQTLATPW